MESVTFEEIYNSNFNYVYRFFYYKSVNSSEIEDLVHEVFMRFYKKYGSSTFDLIEGKRILFGFSNNIYKEWVRKCIKEKRSEFLDNYDYSESIDEDDFDDPEYEERVEGRKQILTQAIEQLNPKMKLILQYRFIHNMTRREVAEKLNMKEKDVHTYQKRGIKYLKKIINK